MKKKAYITPGIAKMTAEPESLMLTVSASGDGIYGDSTPDEDTGDNRSRLYESFDIWEDNELDEYQ